MIIFNFSIFAHGLCSSELFYLANNCYKCSIRRYINKEIISLLPRMDLFIFLFRVNYIVSPPLYLLDEIVLISSLVIRNYFIMFILFLRLSFLFCVIARSNSCSYSCIFFSSFLYFSNSWDVILIRFYRRINLLIKISKIEEALWGIPIVTSQRSLKISPIPTLCFLPSRYDSVKFKAIPLIS